MGGHGAPSADRTTRELVRFYLLDHRTWLGRAIDIGLLGLNLLFVLVFVAETYSLSASFQRRLWQFEVAIAVVFLVEYVLRLYGAESRIAEATSPYTVVDLVAILPTFTVLLLPGVTLVDVGFLRVIRIVRVLRFYRFTQDEEFFFGTVSVGRLRSMRLLLTVLSLFFVAAGLFYSVEAAQNPDVSTFGDAFYFTVVTLTTVGFGDVVPVTRAGRWVTVAAVLAGIILIPWQASKIVRAWTPGDKRHVTCPNCGLASHDADASHCKACGHVIYQEYDPDEQ